MSDDDPKEPAAAGESPRAAPDDAKRKRGRLMDFFAALFGTFLFGWAASYLGSEHGIDWLYFTGLALVALPLLILMAWLGH